MRKPVFTATVLAAVSITAVAQSSDFYQLPLPGPATLQTIDFSDVDFKPIRTAGSGHGAVADGDALRGHVESLVDIALQSRARNPQRWGNFSGFPEEKAVIAYMREHLEHAGVTDIVVDTFDQMPWSLTTRWNVSLIGPGGQTVELQSAVPMGVGDRSKIDPITAPLIYVGRGLAADLAGRDVSGKIAVIRSETAPHFYDFLTRGSMARLSDAGAVGVLRLWDTPGNMQLQLGNCPTISCFNLGGEDSAFLEAVLAAAGAAGELDELRVSLDMTVEREVRQARNLVGRVAGSGDSDENIILIAHSDTWFAGADDNGSGLAVLLGLARYFGQQAATPSHDIYFVTSPGHHHGAGGTSFFAGKFSDLIARNMITINLEHVASTGIARIDAKMMDGVRDHYGNIVSSLSPTNWDSQWHGVAMSRKTPFLVDAWRQASEMHLYTQPASVWEPAGRLVPGEAAAMHAAGALVVQNAETPHWYHSSGSTADTVSPESLERAFLFFTEFVKLLDRASKAEIASR